MGSVSLWSRLWVAAESENMARGCQGLKRGVVDGMTLGRGSGPGAVQGQGLESPLAA